MKKKTFKANTFQLKDVANMFSVNDGRIDRRTQWIIETASLFMKKMNFYGRIIVCTWRWYLYNMVAQNMLRTYAGKKNFRIKKNI